MESYKYLRSIFFKKSCVIYRKSSNKEFSFLFSNYCLMSITHQRRLQYPAGPPYRVGK